MSRTDWVPLPKLDDSHQLDSFRSGADELDDFLIRRTLKGQLVGNATVFVFEHQGEVLGYYALASGGIEHIGAPGAVRRNAPSPIPVLLLARLAIVHRAQGRGIGRLLLQDALLRCLRVSADVGFRALVVHCRDEEARAFYLHHAPAFRESPTERLHLMVPLVSLRDVLAN